MMDSKIAMLIRLLTEDDGDIGETLAEKLINGDFPIDQEIAIEKARQEARRARYPGKEIYCFSDDEILSFIREYADSDYDLDEGTPSDIVFERMMELWENHPRIGLCLFERKPMRKAFLDGFFGFEEPCNG